MALSKIGKKITLEVLNEQLEKVWEKLKKQYARDKTDEVAYNKLCDEAKKIQEQIEEINKI